eukprot:gene1937-1176_t
MDREGRSVVKRHAFGMSPSASGCLYWLDEGTLMYPVGKTLALHNVSSNNQRFLEASYQSTAITAVAVSANRKFVAIAEAGQVPQVQIIDTVTRKRRKVLSVQDVQSDRFVSMAFSADGRHLVTQGGAPGWNLFYWNWERSKPLAAISLSFTQGGHNTNEDSDSRQLEHGGSRATMSQGSVTTLTTKSAHQGPQLVTHVEVCPTDPLMLTVSGAGLMRFYQYVDAVLTPISVNGLPNESAENFTTHRWVDTNRIVLSTQRGDLLLIYKGSYIGKISVPQLESTTFMSTPPTFTSIYATRHGFVAGNDHGSLCVYQSNGEHERAMDGAEADAAMSTSGADTYQVAHSDDELNFTLVYTLKVPMCEPGEEALETARTLEQQQRKASEAAATATEDGSAAGSATGKDKRKAFKLNGSSAAGASAAPEVDRNRIAAETAMQEGTRVGSRQTLAYGIAEVALDQSESHLAVATNAGKVYGLTFRQEWVTMTPQKEPPFEPICQRFHTGRINGMDCSVRKPFLITSSKDHSVRVWNTTTNKLEICTYFKQEPGAVAIHPNGLMAVICFPSKVRVMSILWNSLRDRRDINFRNASSVRFALGGQYFAVVHGNLIDIFNSATCEPHGQLRGHPQKIKDIKWCATSPYPTDNRLITCSMDGMVMDWNVTEMRKDVEHADKRFQYVAIASDDRNVWTVAAPTSATALEVYWKVTLREIDRHALDTANCASEDYEFTETSLQQLLVAPHQRMLFGGCEDGSIKVMPFPLQAGVQLPPLTAHASGVTCLCLSFDESTLFTASEDGSFFVWSIREEGGRMKVQEPNFLADEVLVTQQEMEEKKIEIESLQQQIERLKTDLDSEEKRRNHEQGTRLRERSEEFKSEVAALAGQYAALWNAKAEQERSFVAIKLEKEAEGAKEMEHLERSRQAEVEELEAECDVLQSTMEHERVGHAEQLKELEQQILRERAEDEEHFNDVLFQRRETVEKLARQIERSHQTNQETIHQLEMDTDAELLGVYEKNAAALATLRDRFLRMKGEGAIMRKNATRMEKEIEVRTNEIRLLDQAKAALTIQLGDLSHRMSQLHQDIDERDVVIGDREKSIYALKKQNQELEKHKFVLENRIRQLKAQMEPKQREIVHHNQRILQKNNELEGYHSNNITLRGKIEDLKQELIQQRRHRTGAINKTKDFETYKKRFQKDVAELAPALQEPLRLRQAAEQLFEAHFTQRNGQRIAQANPEIRQEFAEQLGYLATSVEALRHKVHADQERHKKEVADMMMENLALIREIHDLRDEIQELRAHIAADEASRRSQGVSSTNPSTIGSGIERHTTTMGGTGISGANNSTTRTSTQDDGGSRPSSRSKTRGGSSRKGTTTVNTATKGGTTTTSTVGRGRRGAPQVQIPPPPKALEENRMEIRMLRAYVEAMERSLGASMRPTSGKALPPLDPIVAADAGAAAPQPPGQTNHCVISNSPQEEEEAERSGPMAPISIWIDLRERERRGGKEGLKERKGLYIYIYIYLLIPQTLTGIIPRTSFTSFRLVLSLSLSSRAFPFPPASEADGRGGGHGNKTSNNNNKRNASIEKRRDNQPPPQQQKKIAPPKKKQQQQKNRYVSWANCSYYFFCFFPLSFICINNNKNNNTCTDFRLPYECGLQIHSWSWYRGKTNKQKDRIKLRLHLKWYSNTNNSPNFQ